MERTTWTYFIILGLAVLYPLAQSFEKRIFMFRKLKYMLPGILITAGLFITMDVWFTARGIWGFNHSYTKDFYIAGLPVEEWLFFLIVPYCCFFLYEVLRYFVKRFYFPRASRFVIWFLLAGFLALLPFVYARTYTFTAVAFAAFMLILQLIQKSYTTWFSGFLLTYLVSLIPFFVVNGVLTYLPVVWYDNAENLGFRIFTIPVDDFIYLFGLLLPSFNLYNILIRRYGSISLKEQLQLHSKTGF
ncbi:MAG: lycopene cyclase domain-containing protein [Bacteroidales bacterium]|nr:lycopene cyclase domain-containing protein [Bacteroidales bacterium]MBN2698800.1 lycopene cyclase domain-containing protein [Bacteroidales bacterium]